MPTLEKITIADFRNIEFQELEFSPEINCICGNNGEGKTNLLDAIHYLSMTKSAFSATDRYNFRHGTSAFSLSGTCRMENGLSSRFLMQVTPEGKVLKRDDKPCRKISDHIGTLPVVMVSPSDTALVSESGEERRRFVNAVLSQMDREYLSAAQQYNRLLLQRNKMLKDQAPDRELLRVIDQSLGRWAAPIYAARLEFAEKLAPVVAGYYRELSGGREEVGIAYRSDLDKAPLEAILEECYNRDIALKYTTAGVQRDDFRFEMDGCPIRRCGSQGQQKSFLVALKFAQYEIMKDTYGFAPTLLLDDVFDKLDLGRTSNLLKLVSGSGFGQIFITDCNPGRLRGIVESLTVDKTYFETEKGTFARI